MELPLISGSRSTFLLNIVQGLGFGAMYDCRPYQGLYRPYVQRIRVIIKRQHKFLKHQIFLNEVDAKKNL